MGPQPYEEKKKVSYTGINSGSASRLQVAFLGTQKHGDRVMGVWAPLGYVGKEATQWKRWSGEWKENSQAKVRKTAAPDVRGSHASPPCLW